jgi:hypothetical protein
MDKLIKMKIKLMVTAALILAITLLSACSVAGANLGAIGDTITTTLGTIGNRTTSALDVIGNRTTSAFDVISNRTTTSSVLTACHATGDLANPYEVITITNDISPVPANGCPANPVLISDGKITICHATGNQTNPYNEITVSVVDLNGHGTHEGDVFPLLDGSCPTTPVAIFNISLPLTVCHATGDSANPYEELTIVNNDQLNVHSEHPYDLIPAPVNGCPANPVFTNNGKITICHATDNQTNPYEEITVSIYGLDGHDQHAGDIIPAPAEGCPVSPVLTNGNKITICHATGSRTHPYNEITVSINGLNGHDKHQGDIIPAPAGGCPTSPQSKKSNNGKP